MIDTHSFYCRFRRGEAKVKAKAKSLSRRSLARQTLVRFSCMAHETGMRICTVTIKK